MLSSASSAVDKAAAKGVISKNAANREKARMAREPVSYTHLLHHPRHRAVFAHIRRDLMDHTALGVRRRKR